MATAWAEFYDMTCDILEAPSLHGSAFGIGEESTSGILFTSVACKVLGETVAGQLVGSDKTSVGRLELYADYDDLLAEGVLGVKVGHVVRLGINTYRIVVVKDLSTEAAVVKCTLEGLHSG